MARSIRIEYPGAFYHVIARGYQHEDIFRDDEDRAHFLETLAQACGMTGWRVHAWVLLDDHYHLLVETPEANLVAGMGWLQNTYIRGFNTRHGLEGRLFGDRYKSVLVESRAGGGFYYETLLDYLHLNPVRAGLVDVSAGESISIYPWSSLAAGYALGPRQRPAWLAAGEGLAAFGCADTARGRRRFVERLDARARNEEAESCGVSLQPDQTDGRRSHLRSGWYWGSQAFGERVSKLGQAALDKSRERGGQASQAGRAHGESAARRLLAASLKEMGLTGAMLAKLPGSDERKVRIAASIKAQTTVSMKWIAEKLKMKSAANVSQQIRRYWTVGGSEE